MIAVMRETRGGVTMDWLNTAPIDEVWELIEGLQQFLKTQNQKTQQEIRRQGR